MKKIVLVLILLFSFSFVMAENYEGRIVKMAATYSGWDIEVSLDSGQSFNVRSNDMYYHAKILTLIQSAFATNSKVVVTTQRRGNIVNEIIVLKD